MNEQATPLPPGAFGSLLLTSPVLSFEPDGRAVVLLAAQPDPVHPGRCRLEATVVPEPVGAVHALPLQLRLVVQWAGGRRTARLGGAGCARLSGIPTAVVQALQAGEPEALLVRIERVTGEGDALG